MKNFQKRTNNRKKSWELYKWKRYKITLIKDYTSLPGVPVGWVFLICIAWSKRAVLFDNTYFGMAKSMLRAWRGAPWGECRKDQGFFALATLGSPFVCSPHLKLTLCKLFRVGSKDRGYKDSLFVLVLRHTNHWRWFNAKSIFIQIVSFQTIQFSSSTQLNCQKHFYFKLFCSVKQY